jgi:hypothetical protein
MRSLLFLLLLLPFLGIDQLWFKAATTKRNKRKTVRLKRSVAG